MMPAFPARVMRQKRPARSGVRLTCRGHNAIVEDSSFTHNAGAGAGSFRGGIALAGLDTLIRRVNCDDNSGRASGLRMDHSCENVIVEDSTFNRNEATGTLWETALGPCLIRNSQMNGNQKSGIILATAYNFTLDRCEIRNNETVQIRIQPKPRPVIVLARGKKDGAYGAANLAAGIGKQWTNLKGMMGNRFFTVQSCTIETKRPDAAFYAHEFGKPDIYKPLMTEQFTASGNTHICPGSDKAFDTFQGAYSKLELITLREWQAWTGEEKDSIWTDPVASLSPPAE